MEASASEIGRLPEECVSRALSLTSPRDSCRSTVVSTAFRSAADSDAVWARFLPSDHRQIVTQAVNPPPFASLKELYFLLCEPILIDGGKKIFALERESGAKCITLCARELAIVWGNDERYWEWTSHPESRFTEVAVLLAVCWLDISGKIDCRELSPNTTYKAYLIFKLDSGSYGLTFPAQNVSVSLGAQISLGQVCLCPSFDEDDEWNDENMEEGNEVRPEVPVPHVRGDGWMEIELGEFFNDDGGDGEVVMSLREVESGHWKRGLIVEGIQLRPS